MAVTRKTVQAVDAELERRIAAWRSYLDRRRALDGDDGDELEDHLRSQVDALRASGLSPDEAFLVAVKRVGEMDALTGEYAREHSERLWKQLVSAGEPGAPGTQSPRVEALVAVGLGATAAAAFKITGWAGLAADEWFYALNFSLFVLPCLAAYFAWKRRVHARKWARSAAAFGLAAACANGIPYEPEGSTAALAAMHLPIALWLAIGYLYAGGRWGSHARRMDFIRFTGELVIYYVLIALGGGVLTGTTMAVFGAVGVDAEWFAQNWILPCGALGAVLVASWLVEAKQSVVENMAPVLTRLFTPLLLAVLLAFLGTVAWTGNAVAIEREVLIGFDLVLVLVLGMVVYSVSARDPRSGPSVSDALQLALISSALLVDALALGAISARISEFGSSPNKVAALGENLILLVNLSWSAWLYVDFLRGRRPFDAIAKWQTAYLPVYAVWAAVVVAVFPALFGTG